MADLRLRGTWALMAASAEGLLRPAATTPSYWGPSHPAEVVRRVVGLPEQDFLGQVVRRGWLRPGYGPLKPHHRNVLLWCRPRAVVVADQADRLGESCRRHFLDALSCGLAQAEAGPPDGPLLWLARRAIEVAGGPDGTPAMVFGLDVHDLRTVTQPWDRVMGDPLVGRTRPYDLRRDQGHELVDLEPLPDHPA